MIFICTFVVRGYLRSAFCVLYVTYRICGFVYEPQMITKKITAQLQLSGYLF